MKYVLYFFVVLMMLSCDKQDLKGVLIKKYHIPNRPYTYFMQSGKSLIPITQVIPEEWVIVIHDSIKRDLSVDKELWVNSQVGDTVYRKNGALSFEKSRIHQ